MKSVTASLVVCLAAGVLLPRAQAAESDNSDLAKKALTILEQNCAQCHGPNGKGEGHGVMDCILDVKKLIADEEHYVVPNNPAESLILKRIKAGKMPPKKDDDGKAVTQRPSAADLAVLEQWIAAGAPAPSDAVAEQREFIGPDAMIDLMNNDLNKMKRPIDRQHTRYFILTHLYNAGVSEAQLDLYRAGLSKLVNSLSRKNVHIVLPKAVEGSHNTILRIDLREYSWNQRTWEDVLATYPYAVLPNTAPAQAVCDATDCKMPFMRADWFVYTASKPPLYENLLGIPASVQELEKQLGIDSDDDVLRERVARAAFNKSGVSNNNRLIERHEFANGAYYRSADFGNSVDEGKNLFAHPLDYVPDGGEIIFNLPNGLQAYMLVNKDGQRIEVGPIKIVHDDTQPDKGVVNGISCMTCHDRGMKDKDDEIRAHVKANPNAFTADEQDKIFALYPEREKFREFLEEDAARFRKACEKTGASFDKDEPVKVVASRFERELDMPLAASEMGLTIEDFKKVLNDNSDLGKVFGLLNVNGGTVKREVFEAKFPDLVTAGGVGVLQGALLTGPADKLVQRAKDALDKGDKTAALDLYTQAAAKDPNNLAAHQGRGDLLFEDAKYADAIDAYSKAVGLDPNDSVSVGNRGLAHYQLGDKDLALADLNAAIDLQTQNANIYATRGDIRRDEKDLAGAVADYTDANTKDPLNEDIAGKLATALNDRGIDSLDQQKYTDAIADFQKAHDLASKDVNIVYNLGLAHNANGDHKEAIDDFQAAIDLDATYVNAYQQKAIAEFDLDKFPDAIDDLKKAVDLQPDDALLHAQLGHCYLQNGDYDEAIDQASTAIDKDDTAYARNIRGNAYKKRDGPNDADLAQADFDKAAELEKDK